MITKENFGKRISDLRIGGGGQNSAREMSLALGQRILIRQVGGTR